MTQGYQNPQDMSIQELINGIAAMDAEINFLKAQNQAFADEEEDEVIIDEEEDYDNEYFVADSYDDVRERNPSLCDY